MFAEKRFLFSEGNEESIFTVSPGRGKGIGYKNNGQMNKYYFVSSYHS